MRIAKQLSVFLINQPGRLATVSSALAKDKINVTALTVMDSTENGVLRLVTDDGVKARRCLERAGCAVTETDVLLTELPNRPGAFASVAKTLAEAHLNIDYAYCTAGAPGGKTTAIFKVPFLEKALHVLGGNARRPEHDAKVPKTQRSMHR